MEANKATPTINHSKRNEVHLLFSNYNSLLIPFNFSRSGAGNPFQYFVILGSSQQKQPTPQPLHRRNFPGSIIHILLLSNFPSLTTKAVGSSPTLHRPYQKSAASAKRMLSIAAGGILDNPCT